MTYGLMSTETKTYLLNNGDPIGNCKMRELCGDDGNTTDTVCIKPLDHDGNHVPALREHIVDCFDISITCDGALDEEFTVGLHGISLPDLMRLLQQMLDIERLSNYLIEAYNYIRTEGDSPVQVRRYFADDEVV